MTDNHIAPLSREGNALVAPSCTERPAQVAAPAGDDEVIRGSAAIAHAFGWSRSTLNRMKARLPLRKGCTGGKTSPLEIDRRDVEAFKRARRG
ncbi:hypothetical protein [Ancylobacter vacuolatus]|uniref:Transcriptional regulator, AlpA family n=1 Tax=Ancylobacter vacuolatus TaxID=223389 RepID=A0ABU0DHT8_9HYPH|nr:hypothetical protein [Ancylobacter vacuolatus]MDQ0347876.1 hypothetical protein [Ancylobacter vacuolatus]